MILGTPSPCFQEIDDAVAQLMADRGDDRPVVFNWQAGEVPCGAIIYNFDFPGIHFGLDAMGAAALRASEVWDFSNAGTAMWRAINVAAKHVPLGWHPTMKRFERRVPDIDVVFVGSVNERRRRVLDALLGEGYSVVPAPLDRRGRDDVLARCRCTINMLFYPNGTYPMLRAAHLLSNDVPYVGELAPECEWDPSHGDFVDYANLVSEVISVLKNDGERGWLEEFEAMPMRLP